MSKRKEETMLDLNQIVRHLQKNGMDYVTAVEAAGFTRACRDAGLDVDQLNDATFDTLQHLFVACPDIETFITEMARNAPSLQRCDADALAQIADDTLDVMAMVSDERLASFRRERIPPPLEYANQNGALRWALSLKRFAQLEPAVDGTLH
jgi:hypothetical protein